MVDCLCVQESALLVMKCIDFPFPGEDQPINGPELRLRGGALLGCIEHAPLQPHRFVAFQSHLGEQRHSAAGSSVPATDKIGHKKFSWRGACDTERSLISSNVSK